MQNLRARNIITLAQDHVPQRVAWVRILYIIILGTQATMILLKTIASCSTSRNFDRAGTYCAPLLTTYLGNSDNIMSPMHATLLNYVAIDYIYVSIL